MAESNACFREFDLDRIIKAVKDEKNVYNWFQRANDNFFYSYRCILTGGLRSATGFIVTALALNYIFPVSNPVGISFGVGVACSIVPPFVNTGLNKKRDLNYHHLLSAIRYFKEDLQASKSVMAQTEKTLINIVNKEKTKGVDLSEEKMEYMQKYAGCLGDSINKFDAKLDELIDKYNLSIRVKGAKKKHAKMYEIINFISGIRDHLDDLYDEARYAYNVVRGEDFYSPEYTRGNKLLKFVDEKLYNDQLKQYQNQEQADNTDYDMDRFNGKTSERNM